MYTYRDLDNWMFHRERLSVNKTHPNKLTRWKANQYRGRMNLSRKENWVFGDRRTGKYLQMSSWYGIERHVLVKGTSSPNGGNLREYWRVRNKAKAKDHAPSYQKVAKNQNGVCLTCGKSLFNGEELHLYQVVQRKDGGKDTYENLVLIRLYCHQREHGMKKEDVW